MSVYVYLYLSFVDVSIITITHRSTVCTLIGLGNNEKKKTNSRSYRGFLLSQLWYVCTYALFISSGELVGRFVN